MVFRQRTRCAEAALSRAAEFQHGVTAIVLLVLIGWAAPCMAQMTIYLDASLPVSSCDTYNPTSRSCSGGTSKAFRTPGDSAAAVTAGTTVVLRAGTYGQIAPPRSGTSAQPIVYRAASSETPTITSSDVALMVRFSYIVFDGLTVTDALGFARLEDVSHVTIRNSTFLRATANGTTGGIKLVRSTDNRISGNRITEGNDSLVLQDASDRNLIDGNVFTDGRHSLISLRCSSFNVFRDNVFANSEQKALEIYDCEGTSDGPVRYDATKHNLFDRNQFTKTPVQDRDYVNNAIQHGAQWTIVRRNVFRNNGGGAVNFQYYSDESIYVYGNRLYNNTFFSNRCYAIVGASKVSGRYYDNRVQNNIVYKNTDCSGGSSQTRIEDSGAVILTNNAVVTSAPGFVNEAQSDLHLASGSAMIDAGRALTTVAAAGSGTALRVADASYFYDGYRIDGESGDVIQIVGQTSTATVVAVDYATNTLTLDRSLTSAAGAGVSLAFTGAGPDMGAYEFGAPLRPPAAPTNVHVVAAAASTPDQAAQNSMLRPGWSQASQRDGGR